MKVVTACYELLRELGLGHYRAYEAAYVKALGLLPSDPEIKYVVYIDERSYNIYKPGVETAIKGKNLELKFFDLDNSEFKKETTAIKDRLFEANAEYYKTVDKHSAVNNYVELMLEKFNFVKDNITDDDDFVIWLDVGLFLNSCNFPWRWWIGENCHKIQFFRKLREFVGDDFIVFQSEFMPHGQHSYILNDLYPEAAGLNRVVSGGLWGGNPKKTKELCEEFITYGHYILGRDSLTSDQECMTLAIMKDMSRFKILEFGDWYDYQKVFLEIMGVYNPQRYNKEICDLNNLYD